MNVEEALNVIWMRCQHNKETEEAYETLKAERPHGEWIPCFERLPEPQEVGDKDYSDWVQVTILTDSYTYYVCTAYYCFSEHKWCTERMVCGEVIAWMPLTDPYKEEGEEEVEK